MISCWVFGILSLITAFDPNLWTPYDKETIAAMIDSDDFQTLDVTYTLKPFMIYIHGEGNIARPPEVIQDVFSVYYNYTDYNYIERVHAVIVKDRDDCSKIALRSNITLPDDSPAPLYQIIKTDTRKIQEEDEDMTDFVECGTSEDNLTENGYSEDCYTPDKENYGLFGNIDSPATGYTFSPGCGFNSTYLAVYLGPDMLFSGNGQCCPSEQWQDHGPQQYGPDRPFKEVFTYYGNDVLVNDGPYASMGYCVPNALGHCFAPYWV